MATYSSFLAWKIPWTEQPGGLQSTGLQRAGLEWPTEQERAGTTAFAVSPLITAVICLKGCYLI